VPRLIDVQSRLSMSDATVGVVLAVGAIGGIAFGLVAGRASARWGSGRVAVVTILLCALVAPLTALAPSPWILAVILAWMMGMDAISDAAMNAHGIRVQKLYSTSILNSFHGCWSLGTVIGGAIGAGSLLIGAPLLPTLIFSAAIAVLATVIASRNLLPGSDPDTHLDEEVPSFADLGSVGQRFRVASLTPLTFMLGIFTLLAVTVEEIPPRWSSIYLGLIGVDEQFVGIAFVAFTVAMMAGRFTGDRLVDRFGELTVVRLSMVAATVALVFGLISSSLIGFTLACIVTGYGIATLFPAAMRAAAHIPGIRPASGVTVVSWLARSGFFIARLIVGFVAESAGPGWGIACAAAAAAIIVPMATVLRWGSTPSPRAVNSTG